MHIQLDHLAIKLARLVEKKASQQSSPGQKSWLVKLAKFDLSLAQLSPSLFFFIYRILHDLAILKLFDESMNQ